MLVSVVPIGNSRGIRFPKIILDKFNVTDKMNMEVTDKGITLTPVKIRVRDGLKHSLKCMQTKKTFLKKYRNREHLNGKSIRSSSD